MKRLSFFFSKVCYGTVPIIRCYTQGDDGFLVCFESLNGQYSRSPHGPLLESLELPRLINAVGQLGIMVMNHLSETIGEHYQSLRS